jgi:hypothetical protein
MALAAGCVERRVYVPVYATQPQPAPAPTVVVQTPPPKVPAEVVPVAPGPAYVWTPGYWAWNGTWVWVRGAYVVRPRPHAVWVGGHWASHGRGYVWVGGYWR